MTTPLENIMKSVGDVALGFDHGLGDFILFLPVFKELCRITNRKIKIVSPSKRQFQLIDKSVTVMDSLSDGRFGYIYRILYPDSSRLNVPMEHFNEPAKPFLCSKYELGMPDFIWEPLKMEHRNDPNSNKRVGVHFCGHTGMNTKFCPPDVARRIWDEIKSKGYEPFEVHMEPSFSMEYNIGDRGNHYFDFVNESNSLRFGKPDLGRMMEAIGRCRFFIGIDSGPVYLASAMLGIDNVVGLYNQKRHDHFMPIRISMVSVSPYRKNSIKRVLNQKETIYR